MPAGPWPHWWIAMADIAFTLFLPRTERARRRAKRKLIGRLIGVHSAAARFGYGIEPIARRRRWFR